MSYNHAQCLRDRWLHRRHSGGADDWTVVIDQSGHQWVMSPGNQAPTVKLEEALAKKSRVVTGVKGNMQTPVSSAAPSGPAALPEAAGVEPVGPGSEPVAPDAVPAGPGVQPAAPAVPGVVRAVSGVLPNATSLAPICSAEPGVVAGTALGDVTGMARRTTPVPVPPPADDEEGPEEPDEDDFPPSPPADSDSS
jgi:hypothetical protein